MTTYNDENPMPCRDCGEPCIDAGPGLGWQCVSDKCKTPPIQVIVCGRCHRLTNRIDEYLSAGGLFNPEAMEHDKVRELLLECGQELKRHAHI